MREYSHIVEKSFVNGLRPDSRIPRGAAFLEYAKNLKPTEFGCVSPEALYNPFADTIAHPYPQLFRGEKTTLLAGATTLKTVTESNWSTASVSLQSGTISTGGPWQHASFQDLYFLTNGTTFVWKIPSNASAGTVATTSITANAILNHGDRLIIGGLAGSWFSGNRWLSAFNTWKETAPEYRLSHDSMAFSNNWVVWGEYGGGSDDTPFHVLMSMLGFMGDSAFDRIEPILQSLMEQNKIGMAPMRSPGAIMHLAPLGSDVAVYSATNVATLTPVESGTYIEQEHKRIGILGRAACGGTRAEHVFLDNNGNLWRWQAGDNIKLLGYDEFFTTFDSDTVISFDPVEWDYWITDGSYTYILSRTGLGGPLDYKPTSLVRDDVRGLVAVSATPSTFVVETRTNPADMERRDRKKLVLYQLSADGITSALGRIEWRNDYNGSYYESPLNVFNNVGVSFQFVSFVDGKFTVRAATTGSARIQRLDCRYQAEGRLYIRGTVAEEAMA